MGVSKKAVGAQTRAKIMGAALEAFCEEGYSGASISKIAKIASVLPGSIYWIFDSKEDLFAEVLETASTEWRESLTHGRVFPPTTAKEFADLYRNIAHLKGRTPRFIQLIFVVAAEASARTERTLQVVQEVRSFWRERAEQAIVNDIIGEDNEASRELAKRIAAISLNLADGVYISAQVEGGAADFARMMPRMAEVLERELTFGIAGLKSGNRLSR